MLLGSLIGHRAVGRCSSKLCAIVHQYSSLSVLIRCPPSSSFVIILHNPSPIIDVHPSSSPYVIIVSPHPVTAHVQLSRSAIHHQSQPIAIVSQHMLQTVFYASIIITVLPLSSFLVRHHVLSCAIIFQRAWSPPLRSRRQSALFITLQHFSAVVHYTSSISLHASSSAIIPHFRASSFVIAPHCLLSSVIHRCHSLSHVISHRQALTFPMFRYQLS